MAPKENCFTGNFIATPENAIISMKDTKKDKVKKVWNEVSPVSQGKVKLINFILLFEIIFSLETLFTPLEMHMSI